jgi:hypothetical protein
MAISRKSSNYEEIINQLDYSTNETTILLKKLKRNELIRRINFYGTLITLIVTVIISLNTKNSMFVIGILGTPIGVIISTWMRIRANSLKSTLDNEIFNNFLIKKIKIFYPNDDMNNIQYTQIKQISVNAYNTGNEHQAIIELTYQAHKENATGIIVTDSNQSNVVTSTINNKAGATAITKTICSASAMLIKDINNINKESDKKFDLEYWHNLLKKGAINEDEYKQKKEAILQL